LHDLQALYVLIFPHNPTFIIYAILTPAQVAFAPATAKIVLFAAIAIAPLTEASLAAVVPGKVAAKIAACASRVVRRSHAGNQCPVMLQHLKTKFVFV
jgi:hypothetical protein